MARRVRKRLALVLAVVAYICLGVPVWWHTTKIQRPALPHGRMQDAAPFALPVSVMLHVPDHGAVLDAQLLAQQLWHILAQQAAASGLEQAELQAILSVAVVVEGPACTSGAWPARGGQLAAGARGCTGLARGAWQHVVGDDAGVDAAWHTLLEGNGLAAPGSYHVAAMPSGPGSESARLVLGQRRGAVLWLPARGGEQELQGQLAGALERAAPALAAAFLAGAGSRAAAAAGQLPLSPAGEALLSFSLCNADPVDQYVRWDFAGFEARYLAPVLAALAPAVTLFAESHVLLYARSPRTGTWSDAHAAFVLEHAALPGFVDSHWNLNTGGLALSSAAAGSANGSCSAAEDQPQATAARDGEHLPHAEMPSIPMHVLHFVAYVPPAREQPLLVLLPSGGASPTNGFTIPSWGGVHILANGGELRAGGGEKHGAGGASVLGEAEMGRYAGVVVSQLRALLGLELRGGVLITAHEGLEVAALPAAVAGFCEWEVDALTRQWAASNAAKAARVLGSLSRLVEQLPTLEMPQLIGTQVDAALAALEHAIEAAADGDYRAAAAAAQAAHTQAEAAFSNPAVLAQLSFPQSHLIGVYVPLFLPLGMSVLQALLSEVSRLWAKKAPRQQPNMGG
ncbi:hypothetical protein FOA52_004943 [Chlamydomonas sp. UWO 241]|nr:hypothetical protein FOA52_004943 [Chlamydomonas sp. UWO 241]